MGNISKTLRIAFPAIVTIALLTGCVGSDPNPEVSAPIPTIEVAPQNDQKVVSKNEELMLYVDSSIAVMSDIGMSETGKVGDAGYKSVVSKYNGVLTGVTFYINEDVYIVFTEKDFKPNVFLYTVRDILKNDFEVTMSSEGIYHASNKDTVEEYWFYVRDGKIEGIEGTDLKGIPIVAQMAYGINDSDKALFQAGVEYNKVQSGSETGKETIPQ